MEVQGGGSRTAIIDFSLNPVKGENGKVVLIIPEGRDITEKKMAERSLAESEARFKLFVSQAPTAIAMLDRNMCYIAVSKRWMEDYNITGRKIIGKSHYEVFPEIGEDWKRIHYEAVSLGKVAKRLKDPFIRPDGTVQWLRWEVRPWYDLNQKIGGILMFTEDITDDVENENRILKLNAELEALNQQKTKLLSVIAHDLKAPIANCVGMLDVVLINRDTLSKEEILEYLKFLEKASKTVSDLIEELLLWARSQFNALSYNPENVNLFSISQKVYNQFSKVFSDKGIFFEIKVDKNQQVFADPNLLSAIIRNLVSNAVKFTNAGGQVTISSCKRNNATEISVTDTGVGVKEDNIKKIFDSTINYTTFGTGGEKGTGLGLNLVKTFVEKHGGNIRLQSKVGEGSTFTFTIPDKQHK